MSFHHKSMFSVNYKIQSIGISELPTLVTRNMVPVKNTDKGRLQYVSLILKSDLSSSTIVINLELPAFKAEELENIHKEQSYLVLSFNKIEEENIK